ncbi:MAG: DUF6106 family protein, partial [Niameybacter sp.]
DLYSELLVKKQTTGKDTAIKIGLIALTVVTVLAGLFVHPLAFIAAVGMGVVDYLMLPNLDLEYEYLYVNGELDIDRIAAKTKRKKMKNLDISQMEILAPVKSHQMDYYNGNQRLKVYDFSSQDPSHKVYAMIIPDGQELCKILLEFNERMIQDIKKTAPRKVFMD